jgi:hypothetical protein
MRTLSALLVIGLLPFVGSDLALAHGSGHGVRMARVHYHVRQPKNKRPRKPRKVRVHSTKRPQFE